MFGAQFQAFAQYGVERSGLSSGSLQGDLNRSSEGLSQGVEDSQVRFLGAVGWQIDFDIELEIRIENWSLFSILPFFIFLLTFFFLYVFKLLCFFLVNRFRFGEISQFGKILEGPHDEGN